MAVSHRYFTVKPELEMDLASVIAMDFMIVFLLFLRLEQGSGPLESQNPLLVTPSSIVPIKATNSAETIEHCSMGGKNFFQGGRVQHLPLFSTIVTLGLGMYRPPWPFLVVAALAANDVRNLNVLRVMLRPANRIFEFQS